MGCSHGFHHFTISLLIFFISTSTNFIFITNGRTITIPPDPTQEEMGILRAQIGSRPPKCERRCSSCSHCEAIQVPTNLEIRRGTNVLATKIPYLRGNYNSNYKPMSWKCKCGPFIFNP